MEVRHFLTLNDLTTAELQQLIQRAIELKAERRSGRMYQPLQNQAMAMIFEKSSTRTRVSFETAMAHFGGHAMFLSPRDTQLGRGEPVEDTARVLSRMVDVIMIRTFEHEKIETFARHSLVPVINALTDMFHPCQLLADMMTWIEMRGDIKGKKVCWISDGNNMCHSYINAAVLFDFELTVACPPGYEPNAQILAHGAGHCRLVHNPAEAIVGADLVVTDVWASMGQETESQDRARAFFGFQVTPELMARAAPDALFMHCLPAHRGEEVSAEVIDGNQSVVWQEAENRLHAQKALLEFLLVDRPRKS